MNGYNSPEMGKHMESRFNEFKQMKRDGAEVVRLALGGGKYYLAKYDLENDEVMYLDHTYIRPDREKHNPADDHWKLMYKRIDEALAADLKVLIDPHRAFGQSRYFTMYKSDKFFRDMRYVDAWCLVLRKLAADLEARGYTSDQVVGITPIDEPPNYKLLVDWREATADGRLEKMKGGKPTGEYEVVVPQAQLDLHVINRKMVRAILAGSTRYRVVLNFNWKDFAQPSADAPNVKDPSWYAGADPQKLNRLDFDIHFYEPLQTYTHQGHGSDRDRNPATPWPSIPGDKNHGKKQFTKPWIEAQLDAFEAYRQRHGLAKERMWVTEWGVTGGENMCWDDPSSTNPRNGGAHYMKTVFNKIRGYNWTIHSFGGDNPAFDQTKWGKRYGLVKRMLRNGDEMNNPAPRR